MKICTNNKIKIINLGLLLILLNSFYEIQAENTLQESILVDATGVLHYTWNEQDNGEQVVKTRAYTPEDGWSTAAPVSPIGENCIDPLYSTNSQGNRAVLFLNKKDNSDEYQLAASIKNGTTGVWSPIQILSLSDDQIKKEGYYISIDENNNVTAMWDAVVFVEAPVYHKSVVYFAKATLTDPWSEPVIVREY